MSRIVGSIRRRLFAELPTDFEAYHDLVRRHLFDGAAVLDVGCGRGHVAPFPWSDHPSVYRVGIDPDPAAAGNPHLHRFVHTPDVDNWGVEDGGFDLVLARYVLEHVQSPSVFFANVCCALKPGGRFIFLTPNLRHPAVMVSRTLSHRTKQFVLKAAAGVDRGDVFPTCYRCNTVASLAALARHWGLEAEMLTAAEFQPVRYTDFSLPTFLPALAYYCAVRPVGALDRRFGASIVGILRKSVTAPRTRPRPAPAAAMPA